jgi:hypothetical protein
MINIGQKQNCCRQHIFIYSFAFDITRSNDDIEPQFVKECQRRNDWPMWKEAI